MSSSQLTDCPFCPENGKVRPIRYSPSGDTYFTQVMVSRDGSMEYADGAYFVIPKDHYLPYEDMLFDFMREVNWHRRESGLIFDNGGFNYTEAGGGKIEHPHFWLIQTQEGDDPLGLYGLRVKVGREKVQRFPGRLDALDLS